jgi:hypothetical protein
MNDDEIERIYNDFVVWPNRGNIPAFSWTHWGKPRKARGSQCSGRDSNWVSPEYKFRALRMDQSVRCIFFEDLLWFIISGPKTDNASVTHSHLTNSRIRHVVWICTKESTIKSCIIVPFFTMSRFRKNRWSSFWCTCRITVYVGPIGFHAKITFIRQYCGVFAQGKNCEARRDSRFKGTALQTLPLLGDRFLTRNSGATGKRCSLRCPCDNYVMKQ